MSSVRMSAVSTVRGGARSEDVLPRQGGNFIPKTPPNSVAIRGDVVTSESVR